MSNLKTATTALAVALALASAASPALAKHRASRAGFNARAEAIGGERATDAGARASALRQCNDQSSSLKEYTWGEEQDFKYRACMSQHGQIE
jgi:hypothetical protein